MHMEAHPMHCATAGTHLKHRPVSLVVIPVHNGYVCTPLVPPERIARCSCSACGCHDIVTCSLHSTVVTGQQQS